MKSKTRRVVVHVKGEGEDFLKLQTEMNAVILH